MTRLAPASLLVAAIALAASPAAAEPIDVTARRIDSFAITSTGGVSGPLAFLGGLNLSASDRRFGGLSGIEMLDTEHALMVSDSGALLRARLVHEDGRLVGLADAEIDPLFPDGRSRKADADVEDIALDPSDPGTGVIVRERQANAMLTFTMKEGRPADFTPKRVGAENALLRSNKGLESVAYPPATSPLAGGIVTIAEHPPEGATDIPGWLAGVGAFAIVRRDDFDVSSARFLPDGDLLLLERRFSLGSGIAIRLRRIPGETVKLGARLDGTVILDADLGSQIDNMEGLAVHTDATGRVVLTLVSDDNHSILQRTLILQFALTED